MQKVIFTAVHRPKLDRNGLTKVLRRVWNDDQTEHTDTLIGFVTTPRNVEQFTALVGQDQETAQDLGIFDTRSKAGHAILGAFLSNRPAAEAPVEAADVAEATEEGLESVDESRESADLDSMSIAQLVELHNGLPGARELSTWKKSKALLIERIQGLQG